MRITRSQPRARQRTRTAASGGLLALLAVASLAAVLGLPETAVAAQGEQREERRTFPARDGMTVELENLAGAVSIQGTAGGDIEIVATIHAESGNLADAQTLLGLLEVEFESDGGSIDVAVRYPVDRYTRYRYPRAGRGNSTNRTRYQGERVTVVSRDDDDAVTLYVDFTIRVPAGVSAGVENSAGDITAQDMQGDLSADTGSGNVTATGGAGSVEADTGSGNVEVARYTGDVSADTGSGDVEIREVTGNVSVDTGSGEIVVIDVEARRIDVGTGSGDILLRRVSGSLNADTGSGDIEAEDLRAGATLLADTGSGDVRLSGDLSQVEEIEIDTGSGDVELNMSAAPGMRIEVETGAGGINVDLPEMRVIVSRRNYFRGESGDGSANVTIESGSGSVRVRIR